jgi:hypothetical protein
VHAPLAETGAWPASFRGLRNLRWLARRERISAAGPHSHYLVMCLTAHMTASSIFVFANDNSRLPPMRSQDSTKATP